MQEKTRRLPRTRPEKKATTHGTTPRIPVLIFSHREGGHTKQSGEMSTYPRNRDLGQEYQQGIIDTIQGVFDKWLESGMGLINPNNPADQYLKTPVDPNAPLSSLLVDEAIDSLPSLDPG